MIDKPIRHLHITIRIKLHVKKETKKWWKKSQWNWVSQTIVPYRRFTQCSNLYFFTFTRKGKSTQKEWFGNNSGMLSTPRPYRFINTPMIMYMRTNGKKLKRDISRNFRNLHTKSTTDKQHTNKQTNKKEVLGTLGMKITHYCKDHSSFITKRFY